MRLFTCRRVAVPMAALAAACLAHAPAAAQSTGASGWAAGQAGPQGVVEVKLDAKQTQAVQRISEYFNTMKQMRGVFVQIDPDKKRSRGRFYMQRPGKFRFDYGAPSRKVMASDGKFLRMREPDQSSTDTVELDNTPFRMLLKPNVDLIRDARILDVQESDDLIVLAVQDRSPEAPGRVQLVFTKKPGLDLKEWVVRDAQGLETKVEISELNKTEPLDPALFRWEENFFPK